MAQALTLLNDEGSKRLKWKLGNLIFLHTAELDSSPGCVLVHTERTIGFKLHEKEWTLRVQYMGETLWVSVTCISQYNEPWDVRIGIVDKSENVIRNGKGLERKEDKNIFEAHYLVEVSAVQAVENWKEELHLFVEIKRKEDEETQMQKASIRNLQSDYEDMLLSGQNSDVILQVKDKKFNCHRCILAARSQVFHAMFEHDMMEKNSGVVIIEDAEPAVFQEFLLYLYTGSGKYLSSKNVIDLYDLGDKYNVKQLMDLCMWNINKTRPITDFFSEVSQLQNDTELPDQLIQFFLQRSQEIFVSEMWQSFKETNPKACDVLMIKYFHINKKK